MAFTPDILVTRPDSYDRDVVVGVDTSDGSLEESEHGLKSYMDDVGYPVGMLVSPKRLRLYRKQYLSSPQDLIALVGEFDVSKILRFHPTGNSRLDEFTFERDVQFWLEGLAEEWNVQSLPLELRQALQLLVAPAVEQGEVGAAHPRDLATA